MGKRAIPCNLSIEEQAAAWEEFDEFLDRQEEEMVLESMNHYLFYIPEKKGKIRECICTHANCGRFTMEKKYESGFFQHNHGAEISCPVCGGNVKLLALGKLHTFSSINDVKWDRMTICRAGKDGALLLMSGYAKRYFSWDDLRPYPEISWKAWTYLAPGKRMQWERIMMPIEQRRDGSWIWGYEWHESESVKEPFVPGGFDGHDGDSYFLCVEAITDSALRYCQLEEWMYQEAGVFMDVMQDPVREATKYLAAYTKYPTIEMAVKLGMGKAVTELVTNGKKNHRDLNWDATSIKDFLRLDKQNAKAFSKNGGNLEMLKSYHCLKKQNRVTNMQEFILMLIHAGGMEYAERLTEAAMRADCSIRSAVNYVEKHRCRFNTGEFLTMWIDYLNMARVLGYDLTRRDVALPKDLQNRHDAASETIRFQKIIADEKKYANFNKLLRKMYEFEYGDLCILIPGSVEDIVQEGKTLRHCVGGYAARHFDNKVTILFMRHKRKPNVPWITMEIVPRNTMRDNVIIKQIHGYQNELYKPSGGKKPARPSQKYKWFLDIWRNWVKAGSKRDKKGNPILPKNKEKTA